MILYIQNILVIHNNIKISIIQLLVVLGIQKLLKGNHYLVKQEIKKIFRNL